MLHISIPTPCHEDWEAMIPNEKGRHCNSCIKTVVDFTTMSDDEVKYFLLNRKEKKVCGRFRTEQLHRIIIELPENIFYIALPFWKKFLAACLLVFSTTLFSCETTVKGELVNAFHVSTALTTTEFNIDKPSVPQPHPPPCTTVGGIKVMVIVDSTTTGVIAVEQTIKYEPPIVVEALKEAPVIDSSYKKIDTGSVPTKNPPKADSNDCDTKVFY